MPALTVIPAKRGDAERIVSHEQGRVVAPAFGKGEEMGGDLAGGGELAADDIEAPHAAQGQ